MKGKLNIYLVDLVIKDQTLQIIFCTFYYSSKVDKDSAKQISIREFSSKPLDRTYISKMIRYVLDKNNTA